MKPNGGSRVIVITNTISVSFGEMYKPDIRAASCYQGISHNEIVRKQANDRLLRQNSLRARNRGPIPLKFLNGMRVLRLNSGRLTRIHPLFSFRTGGHAAHSGTQIPTDS